MTADLNQVFAGVTVRRAMHRDNDLVHCAVCLRAARFAHPRQNISSRWFDDFSQMLDVRLEVRWLLFAAKNLIRQIERFRAGDADERDCAFTRRRGDGGDGFAGGADHSGKRRRLKASNGAKPRRSNVASSESRPMAAAAIMQSGWLRERRPVELKSSAANAASRA